MFHLVLYGFKELLSLFNFANDHANVISVSSLAHVESIKTSVVSHFTSNPIGFFSSKQIKNMFIII